MVASPLNYTGGKYKLLPQILPLFPNNIGCFFDLFGGGGNVSANVNAESVFYNDISLPVTQILETFHSTQISDILRHIDNTISTYNLNRENAEGYLKLRKDYNNSSDRNPLTLYTIVAHSFSNQIRFNSKGEFNLAFGKRGFSEELRRKLIDFCEVWQKKDVRITNVDFRFFSHLQFSRDAFFYCDPPYLSSSATYTDGRFVETSGGIIKHHWTERDERALYKLLCELTEKNVRWALSNNLSCNPLVEEFANKNALKIHRLDATYANCNYHKKDRVVQDCEVLITNY